MIRIDRQDSYHEKYEQESPASAELATQFDLPQRNTFQQSGAYALAIFRKEVARDMALPCERGETEPWGP